MNRLFVNIKVDREERPDIDRIYMSRAPYVQQARRLADDHVPRSARTAFWGGTYFPKAKWGRPASSDPRGNGAALA